MAGAELTFDLRALDGVEERLRRLTTKDLVDLFEGIGAEVESQTRRRIQEEKTGPDGQPWAEWSEAYAGSHHGRVKSHEPHPDELKSSQGHTILELSGDLLDSIMHETHLDRSVIGSNMVYAAAQQYGRPEINLVARPYLGLSRKNQDDIEHLVVNFLEGALQ